MATLDELCQSFRENDLVEIKEAIEEGELLVVVEAAALYSTKQRRVSLDITRLILQETVESVSLHHAIWSANQIINDGNKFMPSESILNLFEFLIFAQPEPESGRFEAVSRKLIQIIGTCQEPEFQQILSFAAEGEIATTLPDGVMLAMSERIKRVLQDDRAFFLILQSAIVTALLENCIMTAFALDSAGTTMLEELQAQGYEVEAVPEINGAFIVSSSDDPDSSMVDTYQPATRSSDWFTQNSRHRRRGRRYGN